MVTGDMNKIDLSISSFARMITNGNLYVDKSKLIEHFLSYPSSVQLVARQRRLGKSLNMDMLRCFLTDKEDLRHLFEGLYIESSPVWEKAYSAPVFYFDFKGLSLQNYRQFIYDTICDYMESCCSEEHLSRAAKRYLNSEDINNTNGLLYLTESVCKATGKHSYLFIDEYDKLLMEAYNTEKYEEVRSFMATLFSSGLKGNHSLEKALLTGVMRISHESIFSGLNNIVTFDVFDDDVYMDDYGFIDEEIEALGKLVSFDAEELRRWYNGVSVGGRAIYNTYSVMSYLAHMKLNCYWGKSGTMGMIANLLNNERKSVLTGLLNGAHVDVPISTRISLQHLSGGANDQAFYSLLVQAGYLALDKQVSNATPVARVFIPNLELMMVWKEFILDVLHLSLPKIRTLFDNTDNLDIFAKDIEYFLRDRLSYHDLGGYKGELIEHTHERLYHVFVLGILSAYEDTRCVHPLSNRESGDGRYDVLVERPEAAFIFEFKVSARLEDLEKDAATAINQMDTKRYGADMQMHKRLVKVGVAFCGKMCRVRCTDKQERWMRDEHGSLLQSVNQKR